MMKCFVNAWYMSTATNSFLKYKKINIRLSFICCSRHRPKPCIDSSIVGKRINTSYIFCQEYRCNVWKKILACLCRWMVSPSLPFIYRAAQLKESTIFLIDAVITSKLGYFNTVLYDIKISHKKWLEQKMAWTPLVMTSYLVTIVTDHH